MIKLSEKTRKIFRAVFRGIGAVTASLSLSACPPFFFTVEEPSMYGMPPDIIREQILIYGQVINKQTGNPVNNIAVYIESDNLFYLTRTHFSGYFSYYVSVKDSYSILFTDLDGDRNGRLKQLKINLTREEAEALEQTPLLVELDEEIDEE